MTVVTAQSIATRSGYRQQWACEDCAEGAIYTADTHYIVGLEFSFRRIPFLTSLGLDLDYRDRYMLRPRTSGG